MTLDNKRYILTISCPDTMGIVASVAGILKDNNCFIIESAQWGDQATGKFFMRVVFDAQSASSKYEVLKEQFEGLAFNFAMELKIYDITIKPKVMILVSKESHCLNDILHRWSSGLLNCEVVAVVSNHSDLQEMVKWYKIPFYHLPVDDNNRPQQESKIYELMQQLKVDFVVLARYMQILRPVFVDKIYGRAINIHHSFLPGFKGARAYHQAFAKGVKLVGATAHFVSNDLDEGPIIEQEVTRVDHATTIDKLIAIGRGIEAMVLSRALDYIVEHRVMLNDNKTVIFK